MRAPRRHRLLASSILAAVGSLSVGVGLAAAGEPTRVVSGGEKDNPVDLNLGVAFLSELRQSVLRREQAGSGGGTTLGRDLIHEQKRSVLHVQAELGLLPRLGLFFNFPFVIGDMRQLD